jgi:hypothetical protein
LKCVFDHQICSVCGDFESLIPSIDEAILLILLFFVALVLAWPTRGLSILAYILLHVFRFLLAWLQGAKVRADERSASGAVVPAPRAVPVERRKPSWSNDESKYKEYWRGIYDLAMKDGMTMANVAKVTVRAETGPAFMDLAGAMEQQGASFAEQIVAVSKLLVEYGNQLGCGPNPSSRPAKYIDNGYAPWGAPEAGARVSPQNPVPSNYLY